MTRAGQEPAQDVKRKLIAACEKAGLISGITHVRLIRDTNQRLVEVDASPADWPHAEEVIGRSLIHLNATVLTDGWWSETVNIYCAPASRDQPSIFDPVMHGRNTVLADDVTREILKAIDEREKVIAAVALGVAGPYTFGDVTWKLYGHKR